MSLIKRIEFPLGTIEFLEKFQQTILYQELKDKFLKHDLSNL